MPPDSEKQTPTGATSWMASAAILMVFATFMSAVTGLLRDVAIARQFGRVGEINAYVQAFKIPNLLYFLVAGGALRTGFVPVFTQLLSEGKRERAYRLFSALFWLLAVAAGGLVILGMVFSGPLARLVYYGGAASNPELVALCGGLMRVMFPAQIFFVLGGLLMGTLNAEKHFLWPAMGPIIYNCAIIGAALLNRELFGLWALAYAVVLGALVGNFLVQMGALHARGGRLQAVWAPTDEDVRRVLLLVMPVVLGLAIQEINVVIVSTLATGVDPLTGPATLDYANKLAKLSARVFGAGIAIALFPAMSHDYARGDEGQYTRDFSFGMRNVLFLTIPATAFMIVMRVPVVRFLYSWFSPQGIEAVATTLLWFSMGIIPLGVLYIVARAFYARHDTVTPVWVGGISVAACVLASLALDGPFKIAGLAMATSVSAVVNAGVLLVLLKGRVERLDGARILEGALRALPPTAVFAAVLSRGDRLRAGGGRRRSVCGGLQAASRARTRERVEPGRAEA